MPFSSDIICPNDLLSGGGDIICPNDLLSGGGDIICPNDLLSGGGDIICPNDLLSGAECCWLRLCEIFPFPLVGVVRSHDFPAHSANGGHRRFPT